MRKVQAERVNGVEAIAWCRHVGGWCGGGSHRPQRDGAPVALELGASEIGFAQMSVNQPAPELAKEQRVPNHQNLHSSPEMAFGHLKYHVTAQLPRGHGCDEGPA
eukprot:4765845-Prymnesium_polylepis.1